MLNRTQTACVASVVQSGMAAVSVVVWSPVPALIGLIAVAYLWLLHWYAGAAPYRGHVDELRGRDAPNWHDPR